jgi:hypothetical protein
VSSKIDRQRERVRAALRKHDPGLLEFIDATRGVFGRTTRLTQGELELPNGERINLRKLPKGEPR